MTKPSAMYLILLGALCAVAIGVVGLTQQDRRLAARPAAAPITLGEAALPVMAAVEESLPEAAPALASPGLLVTQVFTLSAGWNTIYLEVEPVNGSPLVNVGAEGDPIWVPERSTMEDVFANLTCTDCLESVWSWNTPLSRMDYIVDPSEGLWDEPGWKRYFPKENVDADGVSREFLTTLLTLHANTGYLVKLRESFTGVTTLQVSGQPVVGRRRWAKGAYNLVGFPVLTGHEPTVALIKSTSVISDVLRLGTDGRWQRLAGDASLQSGQAYLAYYPETTAEDYTAPLNVLNVPREGLRFQRGAGGADNTVRVENLSAASVSVAASLVDGAGSAVALRYSVSPTETVDLRSNSPIVVTVGPGGATDLEFVVPARNQPNPGTGLLQISSPALGTRWRIPLTAIAGSYAGLWVGDMVINDISEGRLGATNVADGALTIALPPRDGSGILGAAQMQENIVGSSSSVAITLTLSLPSAKTTKPLEVITGITPYVGGYVFTDVNQNGQRDPDETGLADVVVELTAGGTTESQTTAPDGTYLFQGLIADTYSISLTPPGGYTSDFPVTLPVTQTLPPTATLPTVSNTLPQRVSVDAQGITALEPADYRRQVLPAPHTLPYDDANGNRAAPLLNFGYVPTYDASLWPGSCNDRSVDEEHPVVDLGQVINGRLLTRAADSSLNPQTWGAERLLGGAKSYVIYVEEAGANNAAGRGVACGVIAVGAPTQSEFRYRVLLRVAEDGSAQLLPRYVVDPPTSTLRISSAAFSMQEPIGGGGSFTDPNPRLTFAITVGSQDPRNPFKHKYAPDHDNLDAKFNPIDLSSVPPHLWESYQVTRRLKMELTEFPPGGGAEEAAALDWRGATWGGAFSEVYSGLYKNAITVKGYFVIQQVLTANQLTKQSYDNP